jgi:hypothetical protein
MSTKCVCREARREARREASLQPLRLLMVYFQIPT